MTNHDGDVAPARDTAPHAPEHRLGSRAHIQQTLARARTAVRAAGEHIERSRTVLVRAGALVGASASAVQASVALRAELRASVTAYARHLRADGLPCERVVVLVKTAVREATPPELDALDARALMEDVVRWSIEAYYHAA
jgi:hypothetical protein